MPDWSDKITARRAGSVPGFIGHDANLATTARAIPGVGLEGTSAQRQALDPSLYTGLFSETDTGQIWRSDGVNWLAFGTYASDNPTVTSLVRDSAGRVSSWAEDGIAHSVARDSSGRVLTITTAGVTKTISRDGAGRVAGVA